jgi:hypothetical protein
MGFRFLEGLKDLLRFVLFLMSILLQLLFFATHFLTFAQNIKDRPIILACFLLFYCIFCLSFFFFFSFFSFWVYCCKTHLFFDFFF